MVPTPSREYSSNSSPPSMRASSRCARFTPGKRGCTGGGCGGRVETCESATRRQGARSRAAAAADVLQRADSGSAALCGAASQPRALPRRSHLRHHPDPAPAPPRPAPLTLAAGHNAGGHGSGEALRAPNVQIHHQVLALHGLAGQVTIQARQRGRRREAVTSGVWWCQSTGRPVLAGKG